MSQFDGALANQIDGVVSSFVIDNYCVVASAESKEITLVFIALVLYDHICTTPQEVQLIWGSKLTSTMVLFHANRWLILAYTILNVLVLVYHPGTIVLCGAELYGGCPHIVLVHPVGSNSFQLGAFPVLGVQCLCFQEISETTNTRLEIIAVVPSIIADTTILVLTWWKTWATVQMSRKHNVKTPLMTLLLRDGTLYFVGFLSLIALNIAGLSTNVFTYATAFIQPLCSIIITHFLLNLRQLAHASDDDNSRPSFVRDKDPGQIRSHTSRLRFDSFVGDMDESLDRGSENGDADMGWDGDDAQDGMKHPRAGADLSADLQNASIASVPEISPGLLCTV
ncbi:hypothetical protein CERSUDRAFT_78066 [Gelatoporia subvermispora B]|uniref:DUF6533 domain-containing protein n=1 Tax=Ceriporiopsis subvermispora (strain B) TaxID=914234 RepID=M2P8B8_CERS8|nr:hypothetical protein CERSUDRAFT_78066 [Gelatoporia subvermispora B]